MKKAKLARKEKTTKELTYCISFPKLKVLAVLRKLKGYLHLNYYFYFTSGIMGEEFCSFKLDAIEVF